MGIGKYILLGISLVLYTSQAGAYTCAQLFQESISVVDWQNSLKRIRNMYQGDTYLAYQNHGSKRKEILVLFDGKRYERANETHFRNENTISNLKEELKDLRDFQIEVQAIESSVRTKMPLADSNAKKIDTNKAQEIHLRPSKEEVQSSKKQIQQERRFLKFAATLATMLPSTAFTGISLALDIPGKEYLIPMAYAFSSAALFKINQAINLKYIKREKEANHSLESRIGEEREVVKISSQVAIDRLMASFAYAANYSVLILPRELKTEFLKYAKEETSFEISESEIYR